MINCIKFFKCIFLIFFHIFIGWYYWIWYYLLINIYIVLSCIFDVKRFNYYLLIVRPPRFALNSSLKKSEDIIELDQTNLELDLAVLSLNGDRP